MLHLLRTIRPAVALEIGTCNGGCLEQISQHAQLTYSIDIDPSVKARLADGMPNVEFLCGNSAALIPQVLSRCAERRQALEFVLVDGDHSYNGVRGDLTALLAYEPAKPCWIVMHDSANPECRRGIVDAPWAENRHVHDVDLDFVAGTIAAGETFGDQLWGGFGLALLLPQPRATAQPPIHSGSKTHAALYRQSIHYPGMMNRLRRWWKIKRKGLARRMRGRET